MQYGVFSVPYFINEDNVLCVILKVRSGKAAPFYFNDINESLTEEEVLSFVGTELSSLFGSSLFKEPRFSLVESFTNGDKTDAVYGFEMKSYSMAQLLCQRMNDESKGKGYCDACLCVPASAALEIVEDKWVIESLIDQHNF